MKIAIVTSRFPYPLEKGDKLRIFNFAKGLAKSHEVWIFSLSESEIDLDDLIIIEQLGIQVVNYVLPKPKRLANIALNWLKKLPVQVSYFYDAKIKSKIHEEIKAINPDVILTHLIRCAEYTKDLKVPNVLDYMDAFSASYKRVAHEKSDLFTKFYQNESIRLRSYENKVAKYFDRKLIISEQDSNLLADHVTDLKVVSNGVDFDFYKELEIDKNFDLIFVGNLGYQPNILAITYLGEKIIPLLPSDIRVLIAGARPAAEVRQYATENVVIMPWVEDIRQAYGQGKIFVAPIFSGAGQQNKILESMAMGIPCITSQIVANGIRASEKQLMIANTPEEFVTCIQLLMNDSSIYESLKNEALEFVQEHFCWSKKIELLEIEFNEIVKGS